MPYQRFRLVEIPWVPPEMNSSSYVLVMIGKVARLNL
jgi:hypothetical protein